MQRQKEYFLTGDEMKLKPLILKDIAEMVDMDISTIQGLPIANMLALLMVQNLSKISFLNL